MHEEEIRRKTKEIEFLQKHLKEQQQQVKLLQFSIKDIKNKIKGVKESRRLLLIPSIEGTKPPKGYVCNLDEGGPCNVGKCHPECGFRERSE